jgi:hypothetical protein
MRRRKSPRFVVLAVLLLFTFGTPTRDQEAQA